MAAKGYTTAQLVAQELGRDLTAPQLDQCADLIGEAEAWIDHETGRAWAVTSPIVDELHSVTSPVVYLVNRPVLAVTSVTARSLAIGSTYTTLAAGSGYELIDPTNGILLLSGVDPATDIVINSSGTFYGALVKVSYTASTPVPGDIQRAATLLVAHWMMARLEPDRLGLKAYSVGQELSVTLQDAATIGVPPDVLRIVRSREAVIFA